MPLDPQPPAIPPPPVIPAPPPVVAVAPRPRSGRILNILLIGAAIVAVGGVAFAIGRSTAPAIAFQRAGVFEDGSGTVIRPNGSFTPGAGGPRGGFGFGGGLSLEGTVKSVSADSLTITLASGAEVTFKLDGSTTYRAATDAAASDVAVGDDVTVKEADGSSVAAGAAGGTPDLTAGDVTVSR